MAGFISKQPNGKYCRFSTIVDCPTDINMTFEDYVLVVMRNQHLNEERAIVEATDVFNHHLQPFERVLRAFYPNNLSEKSFLELVKKMCDPNGVYELVDEKGTIEKIEYENDDELNAHCIEFENKAREIAGLGPRKK